MPCTKINNKNNNGNDNDNTLKCSTSYQNVLFAKLNTYYKYIKSDRGRETRKKRIYDAYSLVLFIPQTSSYLSLCKFVIHVYSNVDKKEQNPKQRENVSYQL